MFKQGSRSLAKSWIYHSIPLNAGAYVETVSLRKPGGKVAAVAKTQSHPDKIPPSMSCIKNNHENFTEVYTNAAVIETAVCQYLENDDEPLNEYVSYCWR